MAARLEELIEISFKKNTNIRYLKSNHKIYLHIETDEYFKNIQYILNKNGLADAEYIFNNFTEQNSLSAVTGACELVGKGWEKEAIPIVQKKRSFISGFFSKLFS